MNEWKVIYLIFVSKDGVGDEQGDDWISAGPPTRWTKSIVCVWLSDSGVFVGDCLLLETICRHRHIMGLRGLTLRFQLPEVRSGSQYWLIFFRP